MLTNSWAVGSDACVVCMLQEVNLVARVGKKVYPRSDLVCKVSTMVLISVLKVTTEVNGMVAVVQS